MDAKAVQCRPSARPEDRPGSVWWTATSAFRQLRRALRRVAATRQEARLSRSALLDIKVPLSRVRGRWLPGTPGLVVTTGARLGASHGHRVGQSAGSDQRRRRVAHRRSAPI